jgi:hypothetical protein
MDELRMLLYSRPQRLGGLDEYIFQGRKERAYGLPHSTSPRPPLLTAI